MWKWPLPQIEFKVIILFVFIENEKIAVNLIIYLHQIEKKTQEKYFLC